MSWNDFDALCEAQNEQIQFKLESDAMAAVNAAVASGSGLREAVSFALPQITQEDNWLTLVGILQEKPMALAPEADSDFYRKCPKPAIEEFVAGDKGVLSHLLDRLNKPEEKDMDLDAGHIRLMHIVIDSLLALGQADRLKRVAKMFYRICESKCEEGRLPGSVYKKLVEHKIIERTQAQHNGNDHGHTHNTRPARRINNGGDHDTGGNPHKDAQEPETKHADSRPAMPPDGKVVPDNGLAAQLAAVVSASVN